MSSSSYLISLLESLLFVSGEPLSFARLAKITESDEEKIGTVLGSLAEKYLKDESSGLKIVFHNRQALLTTKAKNIAVIEALTKSSIQENLSKAGLEVLSIIAYRAPISKSAIEAIRGVNCNFTLRNLLLRDLIERHDNPTDAREYVYSPTFRFLQSLGLESIQDLPEYQTLSLDERLKILETASEKISVEEGEETKEIIQKIEETKE